MDNEPDYSLSTDRYLYTSPGEKVKPLQQLIGNILLIIFYSGIVISILRIIL